MEKFSTDRELLEFVMEFLETDREVLHEYKKAYDTMYKDFEISDLYEDFDFCTTLPSMFYDLMHELWISKMDIALNETDLECSNKELYDELYYLRYNNYGWDFENNSVNLLTNDTVEQMIDKIEKYIENN